MRSSDTLRPEIAQSWRRAELYGLDPARPFEFAVADIDRRSRLMRAATPVLDEIALQLADAGFAVVLADRDSRIVDRRFGTRSVERVLDDIGIGVGCRFAEEITGTNAIATPFELRKGIVVHGAEHYLEAFKKFTCYGQPILHPATRRLEGVLDITCLATESTPLLGPFLRRAVDGIEQRLLDGSREAERRLFVAFQAAQRRGRPVVALGDGVVLANAAAAEILDAADHVLLRELMSRDGPNQTVRLAAGTEVDVRVEPVAGSSGALFEILPRASARTAIPRKKRVAAGVLPAAVERELREFRSSRSRVALRGEPGTGRTTGIRYLAGEEPVAVMDAADVPVAGESGWCARLERLLDKHSGLVAVESAHLLSPVVAAWLVRALDTSDSWVAITTTPQADPALMARFVARVELPPLRSRRDEIPGLARAMLTDVSSRFTPQTLRVLESQPWAGNLRELAAVVRHAAESRSVGDIVPADLPAAYRERAHRLSAWEQAEHDAITNALRAFGGNKVHAAAYLGISRSTLYSRIRGLGITVRDSDS
ncbi:sigma-54-dependent Fis family transcriptional regulator [Actinophytocola sp.]|uniref:sigma-54-dependent Fis family transcriptional regulator n=1 Tax=Actinophytocola sp. TaxID=1872138 RepID=UPI002ED0785B